MERVRKVLHFVLVAIPDEDGQPLFFFPFCILCWMRAGMNMAAPKGGSHGMCTTQKDEVNADLSAFIKGVRP